MTHKKRARDERPIGAVEDDPAAILRAAEEEVISKRPYAIRQGAEKAYLALSVALERLQGTPILSARAQTSAAAALGKHNKKLAQEFDALKRELHGQCFHQGRCDRASVLKAIGKIESFFARLPKRL